MNTEAPPLRVGRDEIGRVGQAFEEVRQTAIRAAVEEARLRQGLNDVFRSLARRSQSLLHRQLTLLDQMERRASDPEALDDLFRLDHLTTRMRRHAEGLVILAGAPPGRGWSSPVRMVDVMRGAIAEVEDYARVSVATRSQAALAGSAVADVIHLLAELIENATTLSPPYTSVRVSGNTVANGFAIEVEDRGLGMSPPRLAELNDRLANPPEFNPSDSEQLGLFVVSQLAKRHGVRVTLKASPYGGTAAIVLIPRHLVVTEEAFRAGLPGEPASVAMAQLTTNGSHAADLRNWPLRAGPGSPSSAAACPGWLRRRGSASPGRCAVRRASSRSGSTGVRTPRPRSGRRTARGRRPGDRLGGVTTSGPALVRTAPARCPTAARRLPSTCSCRDGTPRKPARHPCPRTPGPAQYPSGLSGVAGPRRRLPRAPAATRRRLAALSGLAAPRRIRSSQRLSPAGPCPARPGQPAGRTAPWPGHPGRAGHFDDAGGLAAAGRSRRSAVGASPRPGRAARPGAAAPGPGAAEAEGNGDIKGLPRRVRQASLAPQLRANPPQRRTTVASAGAASGPARVRARPRSGRTMSALQRGWQEGRSQRMADPVSAASEPIR